MFKRYSEKIKKSEVKLTDVYAIYSEIDKGICHYSLRRTNILSSDFDDPALEEYIFSLPESIDIKLNSDPRNKLSLPYKFLKKLLEKLSLEDIENLIELLEDKNFLIEVHYRILVAT